MFNKPTKNHWTSMFAVIIKTIYEMMFLAVLLIINLKDKGILIAVGLLILSVVFSIFRWRNITFNIDGEELIYKVGVFNKKKIEIPFNKINTFDIRRGLLDRIFDVCTVKVDSGATEDGQEIKLKISFLDAEDLKNTILASKNNDENDEFSEISSIEINSVIERKITFKELCMYGLTKGKLAWAVGVFLVVTQLIEKADELFKTTFFDDIINYIDFESFISEDKLITAIYIVVAFITSYILITLIFIVYESIRLYNFTISSDGKNIHIKYGAITVKEYSIPVEKIHALKFRQGFLQQFLNVYNLEAVTIGYGDEEKEKAIIFPIANNKFLEETIIKLLPQFSRNIEVNKPPKRALSRFIFKRNVILLLLIAPLIIFNISDFKWYYFIFIIILVGINSILGFINYKNTTLGFNDTTVIGSSGSFIKTTTIIKQSSVQFVQIKTGPFHKRKKVFDASIGIYTNNFGAEVMVKNMDVELEEKLKDSLIY